MELKLQVTFSQVIQNQNILIMKLILVTENTQSIKKGIKYIISEKFRKWRLNVSLFIHIFRLKMTQDCLRSYFPRLDTSAVNIGTNSFVDLY